MIVVTGAAGFIGSVVVAALNERGHHDLLLVDDLGSEGKFLNLRAKKFIDIVHPEEFISHLSLMTSKCEAVIHLGALTDTSARDADQMLERNTRYTRTLAEHCVAKKIRLVYASSASVYGDGGFGFSDADNLTGKLQPLNPYAYSKWLFDEIAIREGWTTKIVGLRFFNVFGPNEYHKARMASVVWHSFNQIKGSGSLKLFESHRSDYAHGEQRRDFIYVQDVASVILWFLDQSKTTGIFNLGTGHSRTFLDLAHAIFEAMGISPSIEFIPTPESIRNSYQYFTEADLLKLRQAGCDYQFARLEESVADYVTKFLSCSNPYR